MRRLSEFLQKILTDAINAGASSCASNRLKSITAFASVTDILRSGLSRRWQSRKKLASRIKVISQLDISEKRRTRKTVRMKLVMSNEIDRFSRQHLAYPVRRKDRHAYPGRNPGANGYRGAGLRSGPKRRLWSRQSERPYGMVLVTGPTGSGKTVSLYTCLNILNKPGINISTAEDPAEINLPGVNQVNINDRAGLTFPVALKAFLRQDPDIIMVGEIRDLETADIAIKAAQPAATWCVSCAAYERCARNPDALDEHGVAAVQYRLIGDPDYSPIALWRAACSTRQANRADIPTKRSLKPASRDEYGSLDGTWLPTRRSAASAAAAAKLAARAGSVFIRSCRLLKQSSPDHPAGARHVSLKIKEKQCPAP